MCVGEQPVVAELASQVDRLVAVSPGQRDINLWSDAGDGHQRRAEQAKVGAGSERSSTGKSSPSASRQRERASQ